MGLTSLSGCGAPLAQATPRSRPHRIGYLTFREPQNITLRQTLPELGYVEGRDFVIEVRHPDGVHDQLPELAAELVDLPVDILVASTLNPALAAKRATSTIPVVFISVSADPVASGLITTPARPGGNVTGLGSQDLTAKKLELFKETVPSLRHVAVLTNTLAPDQTVSLRVMRDAARSLGIDVDPVPLDFVDDLADALASVARLRPDGLTYLHASTFFGPAGTESSSFGRLLEFLLERRLPHIGGPDAARAGALMGLGEDIAARARELARVVDRILRGANPGEIPVATGAATVLLALNLSMARKIGHTFPESIRRQATEVVL